MDKWKNRLTSRSNGQAVPLGLIGKPKMKRIVVSVIVVLVNAVVAYGGTEYVTVVKVLDNDDKGIIERQNGERWLIEKGVGALSFWRFEGKQVVIYSPGIFCSIGSKVILPDLGQKARIWNAERLEGGYSSFSNPDASGANITALALAFLDYYDSESMDKDKSDVVMALKAFQKKNNLPQTEKISADVQIALSEAVAATKPQTEESNALALALLSSAKRLMTNPTPGSGKVTFSFDDLFPPVNQKAMGLHKLTDAEKEELRKHVETLLFAGVTVGVQQQLDSRQNAPVAGHSVAIPKIYAGVGGKHWVKKNIDSGTMMLLEDGSLWEIDPFDKINAMLWLPISNITVIESSSGTPGYDYFLINTDDGEKAHAKYIGKQ